MRLTVSMVPMNTPNKTPMPAPATVLIIDFTKQWFRKFSCSTRGHIHQGGRSLMGGAVRCSAPAHAASASNAASSCMLTAIISSALTGSSFVYFRWPGGRCDWSAGGGLLAAPSGTSDIAAVIVVTMASRRTR